MELGLTERLQLLTMLSKLELRSPKTPEFAEACFGWPGSLVDVKTAEKLCEELVKIGLAERREDAYELTGVGQDLLEELDKLTEILFEDPDAWVMSR